MTSETTTETNPEILFQEGLNRYQAGEGPDTLISVFQEVCRLSPKNSAAWTCLAWLYLLADQPNPALKAAQKAVKLNPEDPQARINLAIAMLETKQKGVRPHIELVQKLLLVPELETEIRQNFEDGLNRKPDWPSLERVQSWLYAQG